MPRARVAETGAVAPVTFGREPIRVFVRPTRTSPTIGLRNQDTIPMSATPAPSPFDTEQPLTYSLDRRGPNDPRIGSIHVLVAVLLGALVTAAYVVL